MAKKTIIAGDTFLFTGKLTEFRREEAEAHVEAEGGILLSGVSAKLNYLVVGEDAGSKLAKAEALGTVTILTEKEFLKMMKKTTASKSSTTKAPAKKTEKTVVAKTASKTKVESKDSKSNNEVTIGKQVWMTQNLNVLKFRNGDDIPLIKSDKEWKACYDNKKAACCYINNDPKTASRGLLYNWYAVNDKRGLAPKGFIIPSLDDFKILVGNEDPKKVGKILKSQELWINGSKNKNTTGLSITPNATRMFGEFSDDLESASFWTTTEAMESYSMNFHLDGKTDKINWGSLYQDSGLAVRCLKK